VNGVGQFGQPGSRTVDKICETIDDRTNTTNGKKFPAPQKKSTRDDERSKAHLAPRTQAVQAFRRKNTGQQTRPRRLMCGALLVSTAKGENKYIFIFL
jgi:hypothetical protein